MSTREWKENNVEKIRKSRRDWYARNKIHARAKINEREKQIKEWLKNYKANLKCSKCAESDEICLDFHHRDSKTKDLSIALVVRQGWAIDRIKKEIDKCDVLCANCHRKEHRYRGMV